MISLRQLAEDEPDPDGFILFWNEDGTYDRWARQQSLPDIFFTSLEEVCRADRHRD